ANRTNALFLAQVEPMPRSARYPEKIASFDGDRNNVACARMDVKQTASFNDEANFVFIMPVLRVEAVEHCVEARSRWRNVDHVGGDVAALGFETIDFRGIGGENFSGGSACRELV